MFKVDINTVKVYLNTLLAKLVLFHLDTVNMERFSGLTFCSFEEWFFREYMQVSYNGAA